MSKKYKVLNWNKLDVNSAEHTKAAQDAINAWLRVGTMRQDVEHLTVRGDFPADLAPAVEKIVRVAETDVAWRLAYTERDYTGGDGAGGESGFDVYTVGSGVLIEEVPEGMNARLFQSQGDSVRVPFARYAGGELIMSHLLEDGRYYDIEDMLGELRNAFYRARAASHYALIDAVPGGSNVAWQDPTPAALAVDDYNYVISRDANTINAAIINIIQTANGWAGISAESDFAVIAPLALGQRVKQAIAADRYGVSKVGFNVTVGVTNSLAAANVYYVVPLGNAGRSGLRRDATIKFDENILAASTTAVIDGRWGAIVLADAVRRCAIA